MNDRKILELLKGLGATDSAILAALESTQEQLTTVDARVAIIEGRLESIEGRLESIESEVHEIYEMVQVPAAK